MPVEKTLEQTQEEKAAAEAKIAADKKAADDAKIAADKKAADDAAKAAAGGGGNEDTITIKKADWEKTQSDLKNYQTGLINEKTKNKTLDGAGNESAPSGAMDEKKVQEIAIAAANSRDHKKNEKGAIKRFVIAHPEYGDDANWQQLIPLYKPVSGKDDEDSILADLEDAVLAHKRRTGKLSEYLAEQAEAARHQAEIDANVNLGQGGGGVGQRVNTDNRNSQATVPQSTVEMGARFGHDKETIEQGLKEMPKTPEGYTIPIGSKKSKAKK
jgi:hypothetical protein